MYPGSEETEHLYVSPLCGAIQTLFDRDTLIWAIKVTGQ